MSIEIRIPVNAKIPKPLHDKLLEAVNSNKFKDKTDCITQGLEIILGNTHQESPPEENVIQEYENEIQKVQAELRENYAKIEELQNEIKKLPHSSEVAARLEGMQALLEEKDKRINDLTREAETLNVFAQYFRSSEVKQIEGEKRKWWRFWEK